MTTKIHGAEYSIQKIFCDDFVFSIPLYQRPYAWEIEQAEALLDDLLVFLGNADIPIEALSPYFLGSIVLIKPEGSPHAEVVDGQQRLTTLTLLIAVLRHVLPPDRKPEKLTKFLYEEGDEFTGTQNRYRLTLRERDREFFKRYIQDLGGIEKLQTIQDSNLSDSQVQLRDNALMFLNRLKSLPEHDCFRLAQFIVTGCLLVVVSTPDMESAYRIFSVLNDRGLDLSHIDILKSEIIGQIANHAQEKYNKRWEDTEELLGREAFQNLFSHIRMIYRKAKLQDTVLKEVRQYVQPSLAPETFIDKVLCPAAQAFADIQDCSYADTTQAEAINRYFQTLNNIDNADWIPPAIAYLSKHRHHPHQLLKFFKDLDRLASGLMIKRAGVNDRFKRYGTLLLWIEENKNLEEKNSPLNLTPQECEAILQRLDGPIYNDRKIRLYVLLRLDAHLSGGDAVYQLPRVTVEHILPQTPPIDSQWLEWFPDETLRESYVHRLGNLALLSRTKNSSAQNYDFDKKKKKYFTGKGGVSAFAITTQVLQEPVWTPEIIEYRQKELLNQLKTLWRLDLPT